MRVCVCEEWRATADALISECLTLKMYDFIKFTRWIKGRHWDDFEAVRTGRAPSPTSASSELCVTYWVRLIGSEARTFLTESWTRLPIKGSWALQINIAIALTTVAAGIKATGSVLAGWIIFIYTAIMKHLFQGEWQTLETWPTRARSTNMMKLCQSHYAKPSAYHRTDTWCKKPEGNT